jgi:hypothetical protein
MSTVEYINNCFELGMIVDALNYCIDETFQIKDPTKLMYNEWYSTPDFILSKYPKCILETDYMIPFLNKIVQCKQGQEPLKEIEKIYLVNNNK